MSSCSFSQPSFSEICTLVYRKWRRPKFRSVTPFSLFNCFSVTKAITVTAVHMLVDRGLLDYTQKVDFIGQNLELNTQRLLLLNLSSSDANALPENVTLNNFAI